MMNREPWGGAVGNVLENVYSLGAINATTNTTFSIDSGNAAFNDGNETGVLLTPGVWDLEAHMTIVGAASTTVSEVQLYLATSKGNTSTGYDANRNVCQIGPLAVGAFVAPARGSYSTPVYRVKVIPGTTQTWYAKGNVTFAASTLTYLGGIRATKVAQI